MMDAELRKLRAKWTIELSKDLMVLFSEEVMDEINNKIYMEEIEKNPFIKKEEFEIC